MLYYAAALAPMVILFGLHWSFLPALEATDFAQYMMQAESFLRGDGIMGSRYIRTEQHVGVGPSAYPPGLPLVLVPFVGVFGHSLAATKFLMLLFAVAFLLIAGRYFGDRYGVWAGVAVILMTGVALETSYATQAPQSDLGFCAFLWGMFLLADSKERWSWRRVAAITLLGLAAFAFRTAALPLLPALGMYALIRWRELGTRALVPLFVWGAAVLGAMPLFGSSLASAGTTVAPQFVRYRLAVFHAELYPFTANVANDWYHVVGTILVLIGLAVWLLETRLRSLVAIFTIVYVLTLGFVSGTDNRYLWPAYPLIAFAFVHGLRAVIVLARRMWSERRVQQAALAGVALVVLVATMTAATRPRPASLLGMPDVQALFERVRALDRDASPRVVFVNPRVLAWSTGVHSMPQFAGDPDEILDQLRRSRMTHVVVGDIGVLSPLNTLFEDAIRVHRDRFVLEYENPTFRLYRFTDVSRAGDPRTEAR